MSAASRSVSRDAGFTLVELIAATAIFALLFSVLGGVMISTLLAQSTVSTISASTTSAQFVATTIGDRIRNSSEFQLTAVGSDQLLVARVAGSGATLTWKCYGWYFSSANGGSIRMTTTATGTKIGTPTAAQLASWTLLATGITARSGGMIFSVAGSQLTIAFDATADDNRPIAIDFTTARLTGVTEALTCY